MATDETKLNPPTDPTVDVEQPACPTERPRELSSAELLGGQQEVCIRHGDEVYRLRLTRNGKLILHK